MSEIVLTVDKIKEIMTSLKPEDQVVFEKLLLKASSVDVTRDIKKWLDNYDDQCQIDSLLARIMVQIIGQIGYGIAEDIKVKEESGIPVYNSHFAVIFAVKELRGIADTMEKMLGDLNCADCTDIKNNKGH
jgi:hypothetical protein